MDVKDEKSKEIYGDDGILASMLEEQGVSFIIIKKV